MLAAAIEAGYQSIEVTRQQTSPRPDGTPGDNGDPISSYTTVTVYSAADGAEVASTAPPRPPDRPRLDGLTNGSAYYAGVKATSGVFPRMCGTLGSAGSLRGVAGRVLSPLQERIARLSPLGHPTINLQGRYRRANRLLRA